MNDKPYNVLLLGGYGEFGKRLVKNLVLHHDVAVTIAGRSPERAQELQRAMSKLSGKEIRTARVDVQQADLDESLTHSGAHCVVNLCGPYQSQDYRVAEACIANGMHYLDLADDREFVAKIGVLDQLAKQRAVTILTGVSSVPGLSSAVVRHFAGEFSQLDEIYCGITPGNHLARGIGTIQSVLSCVGKPFPTLIDGRQTAVLGWQDLRRWDLGEPLGRRWMCNWNAPDLSLFPERYPQLRTMRFQAGLELSLLHLGLWALSGLSRIGLVENWGRYARPLKAMSEWFFNWGTDHGGMLMTMRGKDRGGDPLHISWQLVAEHGTGPDIPIIPAELLIAKLRAGEALPHGAMPCMELFTLDEFMNTVARTGIYHRIGRTRDDARPQN